MAKMGGGFCDDNDAFARVYNNLLLRNINTFITLHQCTFNLLFALFFYINLPIVVARQQCITS